MAEPAACELVGQGEPIQDPVGEGRPVEEHRAHEEIWLSVFGAVDVEEEPQDRTACPQSEIDMSEPATEVLPEDEVPAVVNHVHAPSRQAQETLGGSGVDALGGPNGPAQARDEPLLGPASRQAVGAEPGGGGATRDFRATEYFGCRPSSSELLRRAGTRSEALCG